MSAPGAALRNCSWKTGCVSELALPTGRHTARMLRGSSDVSVGGRTPSGAARDNRHVQHKHTT